MLEGVQGHHANLTLALPTRGCRQSFAVERSSAIGEEGAEAKGYERHCFPQLEPRPTFDRRDRTVCEDVSRK